MKNAVKELNRDEDLLTHIEIDSLKLQKKISRNRVIVTYLSRNYERKF